MRYLLCLMFVWCVVSAHANEDFDFQGDEIAKKPKGWIVPTPGFQAVVQEQDDENRFASLEQSADKGARFGNLMRFVPAKQYQNRRVRLTARVKVDGPKSSKGQMWLRVDRDNRQMGAFDNMHDRPIRPGKWSKVSIELGVHPDARSLAIGFMSFGNATLSIDDVKISDLKEAGFQEGNDPVDLSERQLDQLVAATKALGYVRFFSPTPQSENFKFWDALSIDLMKRVEPEMEPEQLASTIRQALLELAPGIQAWAGGIAAAPAAVGQKCDDETVWHYWRHQGVGRIVKIDAGFLYSSRLVSSKGSKVETEGPPEFYEQELPGGISIRLPLRLTDQQRSELWKRQPKLRFSTKTWAVSNRHSRLADIAHTWNVFQHFYPYFDVVDVDWTLALRKGLEQAAKANSGATMLGAIERMTSKLHDGHINVRAARPVELTRYLPIDLRWLGKDCVVVGVNDDFAKVISVGDRVLAINGVAVDEIRERLAQRISAANTGYLDQRCGWRMASDAAHPTHGQRTFKVEFAGPAADSNVETIQLPLSPRPTRATKQRPEQTQDVEPGIVYFNLVGTESKQLDDAMDQLTKAKAIVFDLRGYPSTAAMQLLHHLADQHLASARWTIPINVTPDQSTMTFLSSNRWDLPPREPRLDMPVAFLTNASAISYAESILGIVEHYQLGEIVGSTTAGTNGNVNPFETPLGFTISWTGMRVLKHDGSQHHGIGIMPTLPVVPTAIGIAAGKDEVLQRAVAALKKKIAQD